MQAYQRDFIRFAIERGVLRFGEFTLKSGRTSPYFFNAGLFDSGLALARLGRFYAEAVIDSGIDFDVLFGPAYKGIPLATSAAGALARDYGVDKPYFFNRKEVKDHGEGGSLVGYQPKDGDRIIIIEDVITAGTAVRETVPILQSAAKVTIPDMFISVNRCEVGQNAGKTAVMEVKEEFGINVHAIITVADIYEYLKEKPEYASVLVNMEKYMGAVLHPVNPLYTTKAAAARVSALPLLLLSAVLLPPNFRCIIWSKNPK